MRVGKIVSMAMGGFSLREGICYDSVAHERCGCDLTEAIPDEA
jgi:hypothetical protein